MNETLFIRQYVPFSAYKPRLYLNGFPKAGLHFLEQTVSPLITASMGGTDGTRWLGTFGGNSFTTQWVNLRRHLWQLSCLERGSYLMGHSGFHIDIDRLLFYGNIAHVFIYRDLRDVVVSQVHHILDGGKPQLQFPHKSFFQMMDYDDVLAACITGIGPYPGIIARWEAFAPWLDSGDTLCIRYEDLRGDPRNEAAKILVKLVQCATCLLGEEGSFRFDLEKETTEALLDRMVESGTDTASSTTFRKGVVGGWRGEFKPEHVKLFKRCDPDGWLKRLGYESRADWK